VSPSDSEPLVEVFELAFRLPGAVGCLAQHLSQVSIAFAGAASLVFACALMAPGAYPCPGGKSIAFAETAHINADLHQQYRSTQFIKPWNGL